MSLVDIPTQEKLGTRSAGEPTGFGEQTPAAVL